MESSAGESIMSSLLRRHPSPPLLRSLAYDLRLRHRRLLFLLASPPQFSLALSHLRSLPLSSKSLLLSRLLLRSLSLLLLNTTEGSCSTQFPFSTNIPAPLRLLDLDAAILLLAITDAYRPSAFPAPDWHSLISRRVAAAALSTAGLGAGWWPVIAPHLDYAVKCRRLTAARELTGGAAEAAAVMAMEAAEEGECAICGDEIAGGGAMPCGHPFHWKCILEWLRMRNTCPCCRFELPTVDVYGEIDRVWRLATEKV